MILVKINKILNKIKHKNINIENEIFNNKLSQKVFIILENILLNLLKRFHHISKKLEKMDFKRQL